MPLQTPGVYIDEVNTFPASMDFPDETALTAMAVWHPDVPSIAKFSIVSAAQAADVLPDLPHLSTLRASVLLFFGNGGREALLVLAPSTEDAFATLENEQFDLLCLPVGVADSAHTPAVHDAAARLCTLKRAIYLVDAPMEWISSSSPVEAAQEGVKTFMAPSVNAALYFPRVTIERADGSQEENFPPSPAIAGFIAQTDLDRGVWKAPDTHQPLIGVVSSSVNLRDRESGLLNPLAINCLRSFAPQSVSIWGARILASVNPSASEWKYIPVRRLGLMIEGALERFLAPMVFEANDARLWSTVKATIERGLFELFRDGALLGSKAEQAFYVRCGLGITMIQADIDEKRLIVELGFAPIRPTEFIILRAKTVSG